MRLVVAALALLVLAGCSSPQPPAPAVEPPRWVTPDPVVLVDGTFKWFETGGPTSPNALEYQEMATQAVAHPCVWDGPRGEEPYFNNRELPVARAPLEPWSGNVSFTLDWTDQDWIGSALRIAYQAPGVEGWEETRPLERGATLVKAVVVAPANETETEDDEDPDAATEWSVWVCLPTDTLNPEQPFVGSVTATAVFTPDPVLEPGSVPAADAPDRTGRGGRFPTQPAL